MKIITKQLQLKRWLSSGVLLFLAASVLPVMLTGLASPARGRAASLTTKSAEPPVTWRGEEAIAQLKQQGNYDSLAAAMRQARYSISRVDSTPLGRAAWQAPNPANGYDGYVTEDGVSIALNQAAYVSLTLRGIGYGYGLQYVGGGEVSGDQQQIRIERNSQFKWLKEWYVNSESGLKQGFTLTEPPSGKQPGGPKLRLAFTVSEGWHAVASADGQCITLLGKEEGEAVNYGKLVIWDANGSPVTGALLVEEGRVIIEVDDANAVYPLAIDPTFALQQRLTAADGAANDLFGVSVAINGETAVIGARGDDVGANADQGSAYVFVRSGATWVQQAKLTAADGAALDNFGVTVAISGETVVVGSYADDVNFADQGSAYVFVRSGTIWTQQAKLTASDGAASDFFGTSVGISGDTVVVGAFLDDVSFADQGSAYVFVRSGTIWAQQQRLVAVDGAANDRFGVSVAISGETVVAGAYLDDISLQDEGSAYVFVRSGTTWTQQQKLNGTHTQDDFFGFSVAISGETVVVGRYGKNVFNGTDFIVDQGDAFVFTRSGTFWTQQQILTAADGATGDLFGYSVAISGDTLVAGAYFDDVGGNADQGSAYVFTRSGSVWTQQRQLTAADGAASDKFGVSLAISGETVMVGAYNDDAGANADQGSLSVFTQAGIPVVAQAKLTAADGAAFDNFGVSVAISGDTAVVGAFGDFVNFTSQGSAYVFVRSGTVWTFQQKLTAADGADGDQFGISVAISGDTVVVGANQDNVGVNADQGSAYVFVRSGTTWTFQQNLTSSFSSPGDDFGCSVAISGETVVVGASGVNLNPNLGQGVAYVFTRSGTAWSQQAGLTDPNGTAGAHLGTSVAISGDIVVAGAPGGIFSVTHKGLAYVFDRSGTSWFRRFPLTASDGAVGDSFGYSVAISGNTVVVGAYGDDTERGSAYVFTGSGMNWTQQQKLTASDGLANDRFGFSVAISGDLVVVGAQYGDGAIQGQGSAYVFTRSGSNWTQQQELTAADGAAFDFFGFSVAISGETVVVGAPSDDSSQGSAYVFVPCRFDLSPASVNIPVGGGGGSFMVNCASQCAWTAAALPVWLTITSNASGTGNGTITFTAAANPGLPRTSSISVSGSNFIVTQDGICALTINPAALPGGITNTAYNQMLTASGGNGSYNWQLVNATTLPPGLSFSAGGVVSGTPTAGTQGNYTFTVAVVDTNGCVGSQTYTMNIATCAVISLTPASQAVAGAGGTFNFTVTAPGCAWTTLSNAPWLTVTVNPTGTGNLVVGYSVGANSGAARTGIITVNNQVFTVTQGAACAAVQVNPASLPNGIVSTSYNQTVTATGGTAPYTFSLSAGTLPGGLNLASGGALTGTPNAAGVFNFTIKATDANACLGTRSYTVTINGVVVNNGLQFYPLAHPVRLLDTRPGQLGCFTPQGPIPGNTSRTQPARGLCDGLTIPANAMALTGNITTVESGGGYLTLYPSDAAQPLVANSNYNPNEVLNNVFTVGLGNADGAFKIFVTSTTNLVIDVTGYYAPPGAGGLFFHPLPKPIRLLETRAGQTGCTTPGVPLPGNVDTPQQARLTCDGVTIPSTALAIVGNATTVNPGGGYLTLFPADAARPLVASSNYLPGQVMNAPFTVGLSAAGQFKIYPTSQTDLVIDVLGYYSADALDQNGSGLLFNVLPHPVRLLETRAGFGGCAMPGAPLAGGSTRTQPARGLCDGVTIAANALGIVGNATVVNSNGGYLTFWPSSAVQPLVASSNFTVGQVFNRHFTVGLGAGDGAFKIFTFFTTDLVIDVSGYFAP